MTYRDVCGTRTFSTSLPGHVIDLTYMSGGGIRTECSCGWFSDHTDTIEAPALSSAMDHQKDVRRSWAPVANLRKRPLSLAALLAQRGTNV